MSHLFKLCFLFLIFSATGCGSLSMLSPDMANLYPNATNAEQGGLGLNIGIGGGEPVRTQVDETRAIADCPQWQIGLAVVMGRESYSACWGL